MPFGFRSSFSPVWQAIACLGLFAVVGCSSEPTLKEAPSSRFIQARPEVPVPAERQEARTEKPVETAKVIEKKPERSFPEPSILKDLSAAKVTSLLGQPGFKRLDEPAEIWQYKGEDCTVNLYLYETLDQAERTVAHYEIRFDADKNLTPKNCFVSVIKAAEEAVKAS